MDVRRHARHRLLSSRPGGLRSLRRLCRFAEEDLTMVLGILWAAGAVVVAGYMLVALLRPEKF
jgi:hypothetical protein